MVLEFALLAAVAALIVAVMFVIAWCDRDVALAAVLCVPLFSLIVVVMVAARVWL